jgi:hypothetical protein
MYIPLRALVQAYLPADQGQLLIKAAITVMVVQTECMALVSAAEKEQKTSSSDASKNFGSSVTQSDYGSGPHDLQTIIDVSNPAGISPRRMHSSQLLESRTLEDPAGTLMSGDDMPMISNLEVIDVNELQREAKNFGASKTIENSISASVSPVKAPPRILSNENKAHKSKLMDILCDSIPQESNWKGFSELSDPPSADAIIEGKDRGTNLIDVENIASSRDNIDVKTFDINEKVNISSGNAASSPVAVHLSRSSYENSPEIVLSKRRNSIGPVTQAKPLTFSNTSFSHDDAIPTESISESEKDAEYLLKTVDEDHILHLDSNFEGRGSRVDFDNSTEAVLPDDYKGSASQVADIDAFRHAFPTTSDQRIAASDSSRELETPLSFPQNDKSATGTSFYDVSLK